LPTYRLTWRHPWAVPGVALLEDVDADEVRTEDHGRRLVLVADVVVILSPRTMVVRRVDPLVISVESLCPRRSENVPIPAW